MEEVFENPVQLSKGINLHELISSEMEFHIDADFKGKSILSSDDEDDDDSAEDAFKNLESKTEKLLLSAPEHQSFDDLSAKMIDCMASGDVKLLIIEEGDGPLVPVDAEVTIHYAAYWEGASIPFDSTLTMNYGNPLRLRLGKGKTLPGIEIGLTMVKGPAARFLLLLQPRVAWGVRGVLPRIRPERCLFVIALYNVRDVQAALRFNDLPREKQKKFEVTMRTVNSLHTQAKDLFGSKKYEKAIKCYQQSISVLTVSCPENHTEEQEVKRLKINAYVNLAVCYYKIHKPKYVILMCEALDHITDLDSHCKGLFYYGRAQEMLGKSELGIKYYKKALRLEPKNKEIGRTLAVLDAQIKRSAKQEKEMWQSAFKNQEKKDSIAIEDNGFKNVALEMCEDLSSRDGYAKLVLNYDITKDERDCLRSLVNKFNNIILVEDEQKRSVTLIKQGVEKF